ncbi:DNA polymerase IV [Christensenellaceae bacterium OttesenSCG-928-K19]|nr:DNA polymerase IV [Christensenellaceae bacterium OttesenSCG-928-K19]
MKNRWIFHLDFNYYFAQVALLRHPELRGVPLAVCGSKEDRHGIALTKCPLAKAKGVKTGMPIWQAKLLCPDLQVVPPDMDDYIWFSGRAKEILKRYTDLIEPFGYDENWADCSDAAAYYGGDGVMLAGRIRDEFLRELGLTLSIGVAKTKTWAKLGSDLGGPSEIIWINDDNYKELVWPLETRELIYIGSSRHKTLRYHGIRTIGDLARANPALIKQWLGVNGQKMWMAANGTERFRVSHVDYVPPIKSVSKGTTCKLDLMNNDDVNKVAVYLSQHISAKLRKNGKMAKEIAIYLRNIINGANTGCAYKCKFENPTHSWVEIHRKVMYLIHQYHWYIPIRSFTIYLSNLVNDDSVQMDLFEDIEKKEKQERLETTFFNIRERFGERAICTCKQLEENKLPESGEYMKMRLPNVMYQ